MALTGFHLQVAQLLGEATGDLGFGLGGGYGLQVHHIADRPSKDLDAYVNSMNVEVFAAAEQALCERLEAAGLTAQVAGRNDWFRAILVTGASPDERVVVDLAYDYRAKPPIIIEGIGPVLDVEDIVTGKVRAFVDRGVERDYSDIASILNTHRWTIQDLYAKARSVFPDITTLQFAARLTGAERLDLEEYAAIGIGPTALAQLHRFLSVAARQLVSGPADRSGPGNPSPGRAAPRAEPPGMSL